MDADAPDRLEVTERAALYRPIGAVSLDEVGDMIAAALAYCRENEIPELLADISLLTGFASPDMAQRYYLVEKWVAAGGGGVRLAIVARPELIDTRKFGELVASNRGLAARIFTTVEDARTWLHTGANP